MVLFFVRPRFTDFLYFFNENRENHINNFTRILIILFQAVITQM